jgi:hypothetical protein
MPETNTLYHSEELAESQNPYPNDPRLKGMEGLVEGRRTRQIGSPITKELIMSRCKLNPVTGCWEWCGARHKYGYGEIRNGKKGVRVSRKAYELWVGPIPHGIKVCHRCDNPPCCNPEHLFLGTHKENIEDAARKGRLNRKLTDEQVIDILNTPGPYRPIAKKYSISESLISSLKHGKRRLLSRSSIK